MKEEYELRVRLEWNRETNKVCQPLELCCARSWHHVWLHGERPVHKVRPYMVSTYYALSREILGTFLGRFCRSRPNTHCSLMIALDEAISFLAVLSEGWAPRACHAALPTHTLPACLLVGRVSNFLTKQFLGQLYRRNEDLWPSLALFFDSPVPVVAQLHHSFGFSRPDSVICTDWYKKSSRGQG